MYIDYHVHSIFSDDSVYPMENVVQDAIKLGLQEICFTDHVDYGVKVDWDDPNKVVYRRGEPLTNVNYPEYFKTIEAMKQKYPGEISIKTGLEFGIQMHTIPQFEALYERYPLDFIILSIHQVEDKEFWTQDFQRGRTQKEYNERYYQEMLDVVKAYKHYSVLGHLDLITRYDNEGIYPFEKVEPMIREILKIVIADHKGIEINTSNIRYGLSDSTPSRDILKLYKELGGTIITIGSDSHKPEHLGQGIDQARELLKELGFTSYCTYSKQQPIFHKL